MHFTNALIFIAAVAVLVAIGRFVQSRTPGAGGGP